MKKILLTIAIFLSFLGHYRAQETRFESKLDTTLIRIGEQCGLYLEYSGPNKELEHLKWPVVLDTLSKHVEVIEKSEIDTSFEESRVILRQKITISSFDSGYFPIPSLKLVYLEDSLESQALLLSVQGMDIDTSQAYFGIKEIEEVQYGWRERLLVAVEWFKENWWIPCSFLLILIITSVFLIYLLGKSPKKTPEWAPEIPAHEKALFKLRELEERGLWQKGKYKLYHTEISDILRTYLENRYHFKAMELTTNEILALVQFSHKNDEVNRKIGQVLSLSDTVKFAKNQPLAPENKMSMDHCLEIIKLTREVEEVE